MERKYTLGNHKLLVMQHWQVLTDVNVIGVQNDQILVYNSTNSQWEAENKAIFHRSVRLVM